jgi:hypothetical protein
MGLGLIAPMPAGAPARSGPFAVAVGGFKEQSPV